MKLMVHSIKPISQEYELIGDSAQKWSKKHTAAILSLWSPNQSWASNNWQLQLSLFSLIEYAACAFLLHVRKLPLTGQPSEKTQSDIIIKEQTTFLNTEERIKSHEYINRKSI